MRSSRAVGEGPELALVFVTPAHGGALEDVVRTVDAVSATRRRHRSRRPVGGRTRPRGRARSRDIALGGFGRRRLPGIVPRRPRRGPTGPGPVRLADGAALRAGGALTCSPTRSRFPPRTSCRGSPKSTPACRSSGRWRRRRTRSGETASLSAARSSAPARSASLLGPGAVLEPLVSQGCRPFGTAARRDEVGRQRDLRARRKAGTRAPRQPGEVGPDRGRDRHSCRRGPAARARHRRASRAVRFEATS